MSTHQRFLFIGIIGAFCCLGDSPIIAEELLIKNDNEYLGHRSPSNTREFITCTGSVMQVGNGTVSETTEVCDGGGGVIDPNTKPPAIENITDPPMWRIDR
jgi:hypothetical protein